jgi:hypothetical protein
MVVLERRGAWRRRAIAVPLLVVLFWVAGELPGQVRSFPETRPGPGAGHRVSVAALARTIKPLTSSVEDQAATLEIHSPPARTFQAADAPAAPTSHLIVKVTSPRTIRSAPGRGRLLGVLPTRSRWITSPLQVWVMEVSPSGRFGKIAIPWSAAHRTGWFDMEGLPRTRTNYGVVASLSRHTLSVYRSGRRLFSAPMATGAPRSTTPQGRYFVTDRSPWYPSSSFGSYIFGLSGVQTNLPPGWGGGNLLAIHGTNDPGSIGRSASAGCLRVSRATLQRLERVLVLGAPVIIRR